MLVLIYYDLILYTYFINIGNIGFLLNLHIYHIKIVHNINIIPTQIRLNILIYFNYRFLIFSLDGHTECQIIRTCIFFQIFFLDQKFKSHTSRNGS